MENDLRDSFEIYTSKKTTRTRTTADFQQNLPVLRRAGEV